MGGFIDWEEFMSFKTSYWFKSRENDGCVLTVSSRRRQAASHDRFSLPPLDHKDFSYDQVIERPGFGRLDNAAEKYR